MKRWGLPLVAFAILLAFGCARHATAPPPAVAPPVALPPAAAPSVALPPAAAPSVVHPPPVSAADRAYAAGAAALAEGNPERSLEMYAAAWKENPEHPGVARDYPDALARLKNGGDESFRQGRIEEAGRRWSAALRYSAILGEKGMPLPFARTELRAGIDRASGVLMEKGLVEYRKRNLESAIAIWKSILGYDPSHAEAASSVKTASTQLENLKKISPTK